MKKMSRYKAAGRGTADKCLIFLVKKIGRVTFYDYIKIEKYAKIVRNYVYYNRK